MRGTEVGFHMSPFGQTETLVMLATEKLANFVLIAEPAIMTFSSQWTQCAYRCVHTSLAVGHVIVSGP